MKLSHALATSLLTVLHVPFACGIKLEANFLSKEEISSFLKSSVQAEASNAKTRLTNMIPISGRLHGRIRSQLSEVNACEAEVEGATTTTAALTTITRTTSPHKDHYRAESAKGRPVQAKTGLVFLETNQDVRFVQGDEHVTAEAGKLVVFEGSEEHHTELPKGQVAKVLGPFAVLGRGLSLVGDSSGPCKLVSSDKTLTSDFSCNCTGMSAAIEIQGPATLDLNGYEVSCTDGDPGDAVVLMSGNGATLLNGVVNGVDATGNDCIDMEGDHQKVHGVTVKNCQEDCIDVEDGSDYATITDNWIKECDDDGIDVENADHAYIGNNRVEEAGDDGIDLDSGSSSFARVVDNYVAATDSDCIDVSGTNHSILGNEVSGCSSDGIDLRSSSGSTDVKQNVVSLVGDNGIEIDSDYNVVSENKISTTDENGIELQSGADHNLVTKNEISGAGSITDDDITNDPNGIKIDGGANDNTVSYNKISMIADDGIDVDGDYNDILNNWVEKSGDDLIDVDGEHNVIQGNQLRNTVGDDSNGIEIGGDHNLVKKNKIVGVTADCIDVDASYTDVINNYMDYCGDDGIEVSGDDNVIKKNSVKACDIALDDETEDEACGTNTWKNNQGNTFMPECAGHGSSGPVHPGHGGGHPGHPGHDHPGYSAP